MMKANNIELRSAKAASAGRSAIRYNTAKGKAGARWRMESSGRKITGASRPTTKVMFSVITVTS